MCNILQCTVFIYNENKSINHQTVYYICRDHQTWVHVILTSTAAPWSEAGGQNCSPQVFGCREIVGNEIFGTVGLSLIFFACRAIFGRTISRKNTRCAAEKNHISENGEFMGKTKLRAPIIFYVGN